MAKKKTSKKAPAARKPTSKATPARKKTAKKAAKKSPSSKKKASSKKATSKKAPQRKPAAKKATSKKAASRASTARKSTAKKSTTKKTATRKAAKKSTAKKAASRKTPAASRKPATAPKPAAVQESVADVATPPILDQLPVEEMKALFCETTVETPAPKPTPVVEDAAPTATPNTSTPEDVEYEEVVYDDEPVAAVEAPTQPEPIAEVVAEPEPAPAPHEEPEPEPNTSITLESLEQADLTEDFEGLDGLDWLDDMEPAAANSANAEPMTAGSDDVLLAAAEAGDTGLVRSMLDLGASPMTRDHRGATIGWTPLMLATASGHAEIVALLIAAGADVNATDDHESAHAEQVRSMSQSMSSDQITAAGLPLGRSAIHLATAYGRVEITKQLIQAGCVVDPPDHGGERPLMLAAQAGALEIALLLMEHDVDVDARDARSGCGALERAAMMGRSEMIGRLLERGATIDGRDCEHRTPLMYAVGGAHYDAARVLLENRADPRAEAASGFGVLCAAVCARGYFPEPDGTFAVRPFPEESILPVVELLLRWGADDSADSSGVRPSQHAEGLGHLAVVRVLFDYSGDEMRKTG